MANELGARAPGQWAVVRDAGGIVGATRGLSDATSETVDKLDRSQSGKTTDSIEIEPKGTRPPL
ncbi:MAG: hypothetical protein VCB14_04985 [Alphaproteobacteria bacterium]